MNPPDVETTAEVWAIQGLDAERRAALSDVWRAFWTSRSIVWIAGIGAILAFGWFSDTSARLDPLTTTLPFDHDFANLVVSPAARFDSAWYLEIATHGYGASGRPAFYPLFPGLTALGGDILGSPLLAGIVISTLCALVALYLLHRLVALDFGTELARTTVWIVAWFPSALVLSAVYTEALFLVLSVGSLYAGRLGRWPVAGLLGGLAAASRSGGMLLIVPLLILYLYGPRADRPGRELSAGSLGPRYPLRADVLWILLAVPVGLIAYMAYLGATTGDPFSVFSAQQHWHRSFLPLGGLALGTWSALSGIVELIVPGLSRPAADVPYGVSAEILILRDVALAGFLVVALWLLREAWRRLPSAYTAYAAMGLALPLSVPAKGYALMSLPRFMFVLFPLWIALALWAHERHRVRAVIWTLGTLLAICSALFTTWSWAP